MKVGAVIVTHNRKEMLEKCMEAVYFQEYPVKYIVIIDNNSNDGTEEMVNNKKLKYPNIIYIRLHENIGGAGGFNFGIREICKFDIDYVWLLDDDTIPLKDTLKKLVEKYDLEFVDKMDYMCSTVLWQDNLACRINTPAIAKEWNKYIKYGLISIKCCTFVSLLINKEIIGEIGLPIKEFFIWADDIEYTRRLSKRCKGYMVLDSFVEHRTVTNVGTDIVSDRDERINRYFFHYRNILYVSRKYYSLKEKLYLWYNIGSDVLRILFTKNNQKLHKLKVLLKGLFKGVFFNPQIEYLPKEELLIEYNQRKREING